MTVRPMKIALAADPAGYRLKEHLRDWRCGARHEVVDFGTHPDTSTDYPDYAAAAGEKVARGDCGFGVLVCYTGIGMCIAANKIPGIRAALGANDDAVELTRLHNNSDILTIGAKFTSPEQAERYVSRFPDTPFPGGRHSQRIEKISAIEHTYLKQEQVTRA
jgi:ribose 5-phosphate isomerase B